MMSGSIELYGNDDVNPILSSPPRRSGAPCSAAAAVCWRMPRACSRKDGRLPVKTTSFAPL